MPIGFIPGDEGGDSRLPPRRPDPRPPDPTPNRDDSWNRWREANPVIFEVWRTNGDERVCPICGPMAGREFLSGVGPEPPLHVDCRCTRVQSRVEWRLR